MHRLLSPLLLGLGLVLTLALPRPLAARDPSALCRIEIAEKGTGWPVPMVELRTTGHLRFISDNAGLIAFDALELMDRQLWFDVIGHGYEVPKDGFGYSGVRLTPKTGHTLRVEVNRINIARRLGRLTGSGLFAESRKLGQHVDWPESGIIGCDSVQNAVYGGKLFWAWGDTTMPGYPLGLFHMSSAVTELKPLATWEPPLRLPLTYFKNEKGVPREVAKMPGDGPTWVTGYVTLRDQQGKERLVGSYSKIKPPMDCYQTGLCVWNDKTEQFDLLRILWTQAKPGEKPPPMPEGHPIPWKDEQGKEWMLFGNPLPTLRVPATFEAWQDASTWEVLKPQETMPNAQGGKPVKHHSGSAAWNSFRKRWVAAFMQFGGKPSDFGEIWYAEADSPTGPWGPAIKIITHQNYTFYNPRLHPEFTEGSRELIIEGTYTMQFANHPNPTPRYDYNQILYRLDLDDPALAPAQKRD